MWVILASIGLIYIYIHTGFIVCLVKGILLRVCTWCVQFVGLSIKPWAAWVVVKSMFVSFFGFYVPSILRIVL